MSILSQVACTPFRADEPAISDAELADLHPEVPSWQLVREEGIRKLRHTFEFAESGRKEMFLKKLAELAARENHHPEIRDRGEKVTVTWWSHSLGDLHPNDFIMAAKTDGAFSLAEVGHEGEMETKRALPTLAEVPRFQQAFRERRRA